MQAMAAIAVYTPFALITAVIFIIELFRGFKRQEDYLFTVLCLCIVLWFSSDIATLLINSYSGVRFVYNIKLIFVGYVPPLLLLFVLRFYKVAMGKYERIILGLIFAVPTINIAFALTSGFHSLMVDIEFLASLPERSFSIIWGPWFWVHTAQSYVVSVAIIIVVVLRHFRMPHFYRIPSTLMSVGILITLLGNIITLLQLFPPSIDPTLITCSLSMILFNLAIINNNQSKFVQFSYNRIYHYLDESILVLDEAQQVLEWNQSAENWFSAQGIPLKDAAFPDVLGALYAKDGAKHQHLEEQKGENIYLLDDDFPVVLNFRQHEITDAHEQVIGYIAVFTDITHTWELIEKLEEKAGVDSLTGIPNHMAYMGALNRLDNSEYLPLSIVVCDANGLKDINDSLGHQYGDLLLKAIASTLEEECCSNQYFAARTGGDEFVFLMPNTSGESAQQKAARMQQLLAANTQYPFAISVAMGVATKHDPNESIGDLIALADHHMYQNKKEMKQTALFDLPAESTDKRVELANASRQA